MTKVETGGSAPDQLDRGRVETDLLLGLAQRRGVEVGVAGVAAAAGEGDLAGVAAQVGAALGEDQARLARASRRAPAAPPPRSPARSIAAASSGESSRLAQSSTQMITWTVPPSTDQAAPAT